MVQASSEASEDAKRIGAEYEDLRSSYGEFTESLRVLIRGLLSAADLSIDQVTARPKETASVIEKVDRRHYRTIDEITDKCGIRVITRYSSDIETVSNVLANEFDVIEVVEHGTQNPDSFGYASKHLLVRLSDRRAQLPEWKKHEGFVAEIQIRSILQHAWATISHSLDYKLEADVPVPVRRRLYRVAALLETGDEIFDTFRAEVEDLRRDYENDAASDKWTELPLDLDSLRAAWPRFDRRSVADTAIAAGWTEPAAAWIDAGVTPVESSRLLAIARQAGFQRIGDLKNVADTLDGDELRAIAVGSIASSGIAPLAVPDDVLSLVIARRHRAAMSEVELEMGFRQLLWRAALGEQGTGGEPVPRS